MWIANRVNKALYYAGILYSAIIDVIATMNCKLSILHFGDIKCKVTYGHPCIYTLRTSYTILCIQMYIQYDATLSFIAYIYHVNKPVRYKGKRY